MKKADFLIIGAGIVGLAIARELKEQLPNASIIIIEKEPQLAAHGSGRNSGVLHAGFYYTANSLKAQFCRDGNKAMRNYCEENKLKINPNGKLVVTTSEDELDGLFELKRRGDANGVELELINEKHMNEIEPNAATIQHALFSPNTATVDPAEVTRHIAAELEKQGVEILLGEPFVKKLSGNRIQTKNETIEAGKIINSAGLYADKIARQYGFCQHYTIMPFKGIYLKQSSGAPLLKTNIYPVPNLKNPFLGVHFTITAHGDVKIGPTAIPAFWREHYGGFSQFSASECLDICSKQAQLFMSNAFGFRKLAFEEMKKYRKAHFIQLASKLVKQLNPKDFQTWSKPGIRAQLLDTRDQKLVQDFVVESDDKTVHILNAVSPAFTCSFPFAKWTASHHILKNMTIQ